MIDSKDFALLNDALDGRLDVSAMEHLRRRIHEEAEVASAWEDLQRIRRALHSLPAPAVPDGFLEGVHVRAERAEPSSPSAGGGTLSIYRRWMYAAAAVVGLGIGLSAYFASQRTPDAAHTETAQERGGQGKSADEAGRKKRADRVGDSEDRLDTAPASAPAAPLPVTGAGGAGGAGGGGGSRDAKAPARIAFGAPGGSVPPNLRKPSDAPPPAPPPEGRTAAPDAPPAGPATGAAPAAPPAPAPGAPGEEPQVPEKALARGKGFRGAMKDAPLGEASLQLEATDFDEARARISLLVASIRRGDATLAAERIADARDDAKKQVDHDAGGAKEAAKEKLDTSAAGEGLPAGAALRGALGSFVFTLTPEEARRLTEALSGVSLAKSLQAAGGAGRSVSVRVLVVKR